MSIDIEVNTNTLTQKRRKNELGYVGKLLGLD